MKRVPTVHLVLFALTFLSTLVAGALQQGADVLGHPMSALEGLPFSITLMTILLSHELSHYFASRAHHTAATLPYFIPAPSIIGTFGAFIKMKSPIEDRKALVDIGASGPIVGFLFSVAACIIGLRLSTVVPVVAGKDVGLTLGDSLLFSGLSKVILGSTGEGTDILLHPIAFAGWIGLFVTSMNLLPIGQLDGGHIAFALFGPVHRKVSIALVVCLGVLGYYYWPGWLVWAALMVVLGISHPPVLKWEAELGGGRKWVGWFAFAVFILTFTPMPFSGF